MAEREERPLPDFVRNFPPEIADAELKKERGGDERPQPSVTEDDPAEEP